MLGLYDSLADTYLRQGDYDATLKYGLKILTLLKDTLPPEHAEIKDAYLKLAEIHRHFGQEDQAAIYEAAAGKL